MQVDYVAFNLIIDDLIFPNGECIQGLLGGGGPQTAFGMRLWSDRVGLFASVSTDLPAQASRWLAQAGIDTAGLIVRGERSLHSRQVFDAQTGRQHQWLTSPEENRIHFERSIDLLPESYHHAYGYHLGIHVEEPDYAFLDGLRALGGCLSLETFRPAMTAVSNQALRRLVALPEIFSCNLHEGTSITGEQQPVKVIAALLKAGARVVTLRLGARGALVAEAGNPVAWFVPAVPMLHKYDLALGAGNAFCGGFLVGWLQSSDLRWAGACGSAAASFLVRQPGLPEWTEELRRLAETRANGVIQLSEPQTLPEF